MMIDNDSLSFNLFASCIPVKGFRQSLIYDVDRMQLYPIENLVFEVLHVNRGMSINELKKHFNNRYDEGIDAYFELFEKMELGFYTNMPNSYPPIDLFWDSPFVIQNAVLEIGKIKHYDLKMVVDQLGELGCEAVQLRVFKSMGATEIRYILSLFEDSRIKGIELYIKYNKGISINEYKTIFKDYKRLAFMLIYSSPLDIRRNVKDDYKKIFFISGAIDQYVRELICASNFVTNLKVFSEAQSYNIGLNRKICIDEKGYVKNYISHKSNYGNINESNIFDVISKDDFQEKWTLGNDDIEKCKDCQYRYACVSNTDIIELEGKYYKESYCTFDPYSNEWEKQENNDKCA